MNRWRMGLAGTLLGLASFGAGAETAQYLGYAMGTLVQGTMTAKDKATADEPTKVSSVTMKRFLPSTAKDRCRT